jgi:hypothetical protein
MTKSHAVLGIGLGAYASAQAAPTQRIDVTVSPYLASCSGTADDTTKLQNALTVAIANKATIYIPAGSVCRYTQTLVLPPSTNLVGEGHATSVLPYCGTAEAVRVDTPSSDNEGHVIRDLAIRPCTEGTGTYGLHLRITNGSYAYFYIDGVRVNVFGARALWMNNSVNRQDGFFLGRISRSIFKNGILGQKIGDSITFADVKVWGKNNVDLSGMPSSVSALGVTFQRGQITTENGFLILRDMDSVRTKNVWIEGNPTQPGYTVASAIQINNSHDVQIDGLMIAVPQNGNSAAPYQVIGLDQSKETKIRNSTFLN